MPPFYIPMFSKMIKYFNLPVYFSIAALIFAIPGVYEALRFDNVPLNDQGITLLWQLVPVIVAIMLFIFRKKSAAWGWLLATGSFTYFLTIAVLLASSAHASIALFWVPGWNLVLVGPVGLAIALLVRKMSQLVCANQGAKR